MPLIKCPECGKEISSYAESCPNCGYPIKSEEHSYPEPIDPQWINEWKDKAKKTRSTWTTIFILSVIFLITNIIIYILSFSHDIFYVVSAIVLYISFLVFLVILILWLAILVNCRPIIKTVDGYNIVLYNGFKSVLIIEGKVYDSSAFKHDYTGKLPNGKVVDVIMSSFGGVYVSAHY